VSRSVYDFLGVVDGAVVFLALGLLLMGPRRKFWAVGVQAGWTVLGTFGMTLFDLYRTSAQRPLYSHLYWTDEIIHDLLLFVVVIALAHQAAPPGPLRRKIDRLLMVAAIGVVALLFFVFHLRFTPWPTSKSFNSMAETLNFGAAIMNVALWGALVASRDRDPQLLKVSAGLGIRVSGMAMFYGVRHLFPPGDSPFIPNVLLILVQLAGSAVLCLAFWPDATRRERPKMAVNTQ